MDGAFFDCSKVVAVATKSEKKKVKKKKRRGTRKMERMARAHQMVSLILRGMMIRIVHLDSQCD